MKRSYSYARYWIDLTTEPDGTRFKARANIFVSREHARKGAGPVHVVTGQGETDDEAGQVAESRVKTWADGPGAPPKGSGR